MSSMSCQSKSGNTSYSALAARQKKKKRVKHHKVTELNVERPAALKNLEI